MRNIKTFESFDNFEAPIYKKGDYVKYSGKINDWVEELYKIHDIDSDISTLANSAIPSKKNHYYFIIQVNNSDNSLWVAEKEVTPATKQEIEANKYNL